MQAAGRVRHDLRLEIGDAHALRAVNRNPANCIRAQPARGPRPSESTCGSRPSSTRRAGRLQRAFPFSRTVALPRAVLAAQKPTMLAMLPPLTSSPAESSAAARGAPPIHVTACSSISVPTGDRLNDPQLGFTVAATQLGQRTERRRRRGDVAHEARVAVVERVFDQQRGDFVEQRFRICAVVGQRALARAHARRNGGVAARGDGPRRQGRQEIGQSIDGSMAEATKRLGVELERRAAVHPNPAGATAWCPSAAAHGCVAPAFRYLSNQASRRSNRSRR